MQIGELETIHRKRTCNIASEVISKIGHGCGHLIWTANQRDKERDIEYIGVAFALEEGVGIKGRTAFIDKDDFTKTDDELVNDCAQQILGYPLHSKQDYQRRVVFTQSLVEKTKLELTVLQERL